MFGVEFWGQNEGKECCDGLDIIMVKNISI
jgi:hypothetical protein